MAERPGRWDLLDHPSDPVIADTSAIEAQLAYFRELAEMMRVEGGRLSKIGSGEALRGAYADGLRSSSIEVAQDLDQAVGRYDAVVTALVEYEPAVQIALTRSALALDDAIDASGVQSIAESMPIVTAEPGASLTQQQELANADREFASESAAARVQAAKSRLASVLDELDEAGRRAAATVRGGFKDGLTDSGWDRFKFHFTKFLKIFVEVLAIIGMVLAVIAVIIPGIGPVLSAALMTAATVLEAAVFVAEVTLLAMGEASWLDIGLTIASFLTFGGAKAIGTVVKKAAPSSPSPAASSAPASTPAPTLSPTPSPSPSPSPTPSPSPSPSPTPSPSPSPSPTPSPSPSPSPTPTPTPGPTPAPSPMSATPPVSSATAPPSTSAPLTPERPSNPSATPSQAPTRQRDEWLGQSKGRPEPAWRVRQRAKAEEAKKIGQPVATQAEDDAKFADMVAKDKVEVAAEQAKPYGFTKYTGGGAKELNDFLRKTEKNPGHTDPEIEKNIREFDELLLSSDTIPYEITAFRGVVGNHAEKLKPGDTYSDAAYLSTSTKQDVADGFIAKENASVGTRFTVKSEGQGYDISELSGQNESEVLFKHGEKFEVMSVNKSPDGLPSVDGSKTTEMWDVHLKGPVSPTPANKPEGSTP